MRKVSVKEFSDGERFSAGLIFLILFLSSILTAGCGKKGYPLPPLVEMPLPPAGLDYSIEGDKNSVLLKWQYPEYAFEKAPELSKKEKLDDKQLKKVEIEGIEIFIAEQKLSDDSCKGCPLDFVRTAAVPFPATEYRLYLNKGYRYYFKARSYSEDEVTGEFSATVAFELK